MGFRSPLPPRSPLRAVPDPKPSPVALLDDFKKTLALINLAGGNHRAERQVQHLLDQAQKAGLNELAEGYAFALSALQDTKETLRK
jgi:hypothetical protein